MVKLLDGGVYLAGGEIIPDSRDAAAAIEAKTGKKVTR